MIFEAQNYSFIFQDRVYSLAAGFVTGFFNQLMAVFLYRGKTRIFVRDILTSLFFTVIIFSYTVSFANYKILRWYNVAFALLGMVMFIPCFSTTLNLMLKITGVSVKHMVKKYLKKSGAKIRDIMDRKFEKKQKITQKNSTDVLKPDDVLLYN